MIIQMIQIDLNGSFPNIKKSSKIIQILKFSRFSQGDPLIHHRSHQVSRASHTEASKVPMGDSMSVKDMTDGTVTWTATPNLSHVTF